MVSPVTGRVLGRKDIRVVTERVSISSMKVQVISGVQLSLYPHSESDSEFVAETSTTSRLSAKYQVANVFLCWYLSPAIRHRPSMLNSNPIILHRKYFAQKIPLEHTEDFYAHLYFIH